MSNEKIGKHKGALETLMHEKKELSRLLQIVNSQMKRHMQALEQEGIDSEQYMNQLSEQQQQQQQGQQQRQTSQKKQQRQNRSQDRGSRNQQSGQRDNSSNDRDFNPL